MVEKWSKNAQKIGQKISQKIGQKMVKNKSKNCFEMIRCGCRW